MQQNNDTKIIAAIMIPIALILYVLYVIFVVQVAISTYNEVSAYDDPPLIREDSDDDWYGSDDDWADDWDDWGDWDDDDWSSSEDDIDEQLADGWDDSLSYDYNIEIYKNVRDKTRYGNLDFYVEYPQLHGLDPALEDSINDAIWDSAMATVNALYLDLDEDTKETLDNIEPEISERYLSSEVTCHITYSSEDLISIAFDDHYFIGSIFAEFSDLRTVNIDLKTGKVYHATKDIMDVNSSLAGDWVERAMEEEDHSDLLDLLTQEDFEAILSNDDDYPRYFSDTFVNREGNICIAITYHYGTEDQILRGWFTVEFTQDELSPYLNDTFKALL